MLNNSHLSQTLVWMHNLRQINSACSSNGRILLCINSVKTFSWNNCLPASLQQKGVQMLHPRGGQENVKQLWGSWTPLLTAGTQV